jgi:hypothetical protein
MRRLAALAGTALLAACGSSGPQQMSDWERQHPELLATPDTLKTPTPPPPPRPENLIEFYLAPTASLRYFIDSASLTTLYRQKEIRYVLVARSPSGVENVSYEAIRCTGEHRVIATANADRSWSVKGSDWRDIPRQTDLSTSSMLKRQYFCPHNDPIQSTAEGVDALRKGGHPMVYLPENYNRR